MRKHCGYRALRCAAFFCALSLARAELPAGCVLDTNDAALAYPGTTLFTDNHDTSAPTVFQVDMQGNVVWSHVIEAGLRQGIGPGFDAELLTNGNILLVLSRKGLFEIARDGTVVWSNLDTHVSHDADRLADGHTLYVYGDDDSPANSVVKEVTPAGAVVWEWAAASNSYQRWPFHPYSNVYRQGWTHCNAASRLANGNTLISPRNFNMTVIVDTNGATVWSNDWSTLYPGQVLPDDDGYDPHDPELLDDSNLIVCLQWSTPSQVVILDTNTHAAVWEYWREGLRTTRDADRLPNGNTLIVGVLTNYDQEYSAIFEVTPGSNIVWQLRQTNESAALQPGFFFKAQRIPDADQDGYHDSNDRDDDNDGMTDADELVAGTSPTNANDIFAIQTVRKAAVTNDIILGWLGHTGRSYRVYGATNLAAPWPTNPVDSLAGRASPMTWTNSGVTNKIEFYRLGVGLD